MLEGAHTGKTDNEQGTGGKEERVRDEACGEDEESRGGAKALHVRVRPVELKRLGVLRTKGCPVSVMAQGKIGRAALPVFTATAASTSRSIAGLPFPRAAGNGALH